MLQDVPLGVALDPKVVRKSGVGPQKKKAINRDEG
jgi:hypothetical protein